MVVHGTTILEKFAVPQKVEDRFSVDPATLLLGLHLVI